MINIETSPITQSTQVENKPTIQAALELARSLKARTPEVTAHVNADLATTKILIDGAEDEDASAA